MKRLLNVIDILVVNPPIYDCFLLGFYAIRPGRKHVVVDLQSSLGTNPRPSIEGQQWPAKPSGITAVGTPNLKELGEKPWQNDRTTKRTTKNTCANKNTTERSRAKRRPWRPVPGSPAPTKPLRLWQGKNQENSFWQWTTSQSLHFFWQWPFLKRYLAVHFTAMSKCQSLPCMPYEFRTYASLWWFISGRRPTNIISILTRQNPQLNHRWSELQLLNLFIAMLQPRAIVDPRKYVCVCGSKTSGSGSQWPWKAIPMPSKKRMENHHTSKHQPIYIW